jgi:hypothetical protein
MFKFEKYIKLKNPHFLLSLYFPVNKDKFCSLQIQFQTYLSRKNISKSSHRPHLIPATLIALSKHEFSHMQDRRFPGDIFPVRAFGEKANTEVEEYFKLDAIRVSGCRSPLFSLGIQKPLEYIKIP